MFYFDKVLNKTVLKSDKLTGVNHFFTTRELLLKTKEQENIDLMLKNRRELQKEFNLHALITPSQRHTDNIAVVEPIIQEYQETDALILKDKNVGIFLNFADCTPIIFYDRAQNLGAIAHAGWRGTVQKIAPKTVLKMKNEFNSNLADVVALIGPSICFKCFETSFEIAEKLNNTVKSSGEFICTKGDKIFADLKGINARQIYEIGVETVDVAPFCTFCNNDKFFSYRKENKTTNRISAFISLK